MPCNLAVSITKAAVSQEHLRKLLSDNPSLVAQVVLNYLVQHQTVGHLHPSIAGQTSFAVTFSLGNWFLTIRDGQVSIDAVRPGERREADALCQEVSEVLALLADELFLQQVQQLLGDTITGIQQVEVESSGQRMAATVFTVNL